MQRVLECFVDINKKANKENNQELKSQPYIKWRLIVYNHI